MTVALIIAAVIAAVIGCVTVEVLTRPWKCPGCGTKNPSFFRSCFRCGNRPLTGGGQ